MLQSNSSRGLSTDTELSVENFGHYLYWKKASVQTNARDQTYIPPFGTSIYEFQIMYT